eukprot:3946325-Pyramimonas_sp.AAC.1
MITPGNSFDRVQVERAIIAARREERLADIKRVQDQTIHQTMIDTDGKLASMSEDTKPPLNDMRAVSLPGSSTRANSEFEIVGEVKKGGRWNILLRSGLDQASATRLIVL